MCSVHYVYTYKIVYTTSVYWNRKLPQVWLHLVIICKVQTQLIITVQNNWNRNHCFLRDIYAHIKMYVITHFTFQASVKSVRRCVSLDKLSVRMFKNFLIKILILFGAVTHNLPNIKNVLMFFGHLSFRICRLFLMLGISWMFGFRFGGLYSQLADTECKFSGTRH
jgi:hypothetical protein